MSRIKVKHYQISIPRRYEKPERPVRIAVIADLHNRQFGEGNSRLVETIQRQYPDLVFSVGDLTVCKPGREVDLEVGLSLLKRLSCDCPVYCVNGNHEYRAKSYPETYRGAYARMQSGFSRFGITLLENERTELEICGAGFSLVGLEIPEKYYKKWGREFITAQEIRELLGEPDGEHFTILLAHNPIYFESYALWGADLTLSGHLHGGLVRLPFVGGLISPQIRLFPKYAYGMFQKYGRRMVVTSGLGSHSLAVRVNNPAEVVMLELS